MTPSFGSRHLLLFTLCASACFELDDELTVFDAATKTQASAETSTGSSEGEAPEPAGPEDPPLCGDGWVEGDEQCDDGNPVADDGCTNACTLPACGDGVVQVQLGETCDDGNDAPGDGCASTCRVSGTLRWSRIYDPDTYAPSGREVALAGTGELAVTAQDLQLDHQLISFDRDGVPRWTAPGFGEALAIGNDETYAVGGRISSQAHARVYNHDGDYVWSHNLPAYDSRIHSLAIDDSNAIVAAGRVASDGFLMRYAPTGEPAGFWTDSEGAYYEAVATDGSGLVWALRRHPHRLESHSWATGLRWVSAPLPGPGDDLAVDPQASAYVLSHHASEPRALTLSKFDDEGELVWTVNHVELDTRLDAPSLAALPLGGVLVVGSRAPLGPIDAARDGLALWFGPEGELVHEHTIHAADPSGDDHLASVAISAEGYAVAVGEHREDERTKLWLVAFEL